MAAILEEIHGHSFAVPNAMEIYLRGRPIFMAEYALDGPNRNIQAVHDRGPRVPERMVAEILHPGFFTQLRHDFFSILIRTTDKFSQFPIKVGVPEHPFF